MNKTNKKLTATLLALAIMAGANSNTVSLLTTGEPAVTTVSAASVDMHWWTFDVYLNHTEAPLIAFIYPKLPGVPWYIKQLLKMYCSDIKYFDRGNGVKLHFTKAGPLTTIAFLTGIESR